MSYTIKDFGNDSVCQDKEELVEVLSTKYKNQSVSVISEGPSGIDKVTFVCVKDDGTLQDSYTGELVSF